MNARNNYLGWLACIFLLALVTTGCTAHFTPESPYLQRYQASQKSVKMPPADEVFAKGKSVTYDLPEDQVWKSCLQVTTQTSGILAAESGGDTRELVVLDGRIANLPLPMFARPQAETSGIVRFMDTWLAIAVKPLSPGSTRMAVAWINPVTGAVEPVSKPGDPVSDATWDPGSIIAAARRFQDVQASSAPPRGGKKLEPAQIWANVPRLCAEEFFFRMSVQLYGPNMWLAKFSHTPPTPRGPAPHVQVEKNPGYPELEQQGGNWSSGFWRLGVYVVNCPELIHELDGMVRRIQIAAGHEKDPPLRVRIVIQSDVNAVTLPNGDVYVSTGMLEKQANADQLAFVLAHECDHYFQHDSTRKIKNDTDLQNLVMTVSIVAAVGGGVGGALVAGPAALAASTSAMVTSQLITDFATQGAMLVAMNGGTTLQQAAVVGYSKDIELRADANALRYMWGAGYDPKAAFEVLGQLKEIQIASKDAKLLAISHFVNCQPGVDERKKQLTKIAAEMGINP